MSGREPILAALRAARREGPTLPPARPSDTPARWSAFESALVDAGGVFEGVAPRSSLAARLAQLPRFAAASRCHRDVPSAGLRPDPIEREALPALQVAVIEGAFAVAESGAVWVDASDPVRRAACLLADHVILVVAVGALVKDLHAAYARLAQDRLPDFGLFVAGPSKTADIERALVLGAHGALSTSVLALEPG